MRIDASPPQPPTSRRPACLVSYASRPSALRTSTWPSSPCVSNGSGDKERPKPAVHIRQTYKATQTETWSDRCVRGVLECAKGVRQAPAALGVHSSRRVHIGVGAGPELPRVLLEQLGAQRRGPLAHHLSPRLSFLNFSVEALAPFVGTALVWVAHEWGGREPALWRLRRPRLLTQTPLLLAHGVCAPQRVSRVLTWYLRRWS